MSSPDDLISGTTILSAVLSDASNAKIIYERYNSCIKLLTVEEIAQHDEFESDVAKGSQIIISLHGRTPKCFPLDSFQLDEKSSRNNDVIKTIVKLLPRSL